MRPATVAPFILRSVMFYGIDSLRRHKPPGSMLVAYGRDLDIARFNEIRWEIGLAEAVAVGAELLKGKVRGCVVVDVNR